MENTLANRLKSSRKKAGLSQESLADIIGVKQSALSALETGKAKTSSHITQIAKALGISADWLATGAGNPADNEVFTVPAKPMQMPEPTVAELIKIAAGELALSDVSKSLETPVTLDNGHFAYRVTSSLNAPTVLPGEYVAIKVGAGVDSGRMGLYLVNGNVVLARNNGFSLEFTSVNPPPFPDGEPTLIGRLITTLPRAF